MPTSFARVNSEESVRSVRAKTPPTQSADASRHPLLPEPNRCQAPPPQARYSEETRFHTEQTTEAEANAGISTPLLEAKFLCPPVPEEDEAPEHDAG